MNYQKLLQQMIGVTLVMFLLVGCRAPAATPGFEAPAATATPVSLAVTPTPVPATAMPTPGPLTATLVVKGKLIPLEENDEVSNRQIVLCQIIGEMEKPPADCVLMKKSATSDSQGTFQISETPKGKYFVLYDSGLSDFKSGLERWGGKTLKLSDVDWIASDYCGTTADNMTIRFLPRMSVMRDGIIAAAQALYVCDSPFVMALDPSGSRNAPLAVEVREKTVEIVFGIGSFSKDDK